MSGHYRYVYTCKLNRYKENSKAVEMNFLLICAMKLSQCSVDHDRWLWHPRKHSLEQHESWHGLGTVAAGSSCAALVLEA